MHIHLEKWIEALNLALDQIQKMLPALNDEENLFPSEIATITVAYTARKIGENAQVTVVVVDDDGDNHEQRPAASVLEGAKLDIHFARGRGKDSNVWANTDVAAAFDLDPVGKQSETKDLKFVLHRLVHSQRFDTGPVGDLGSCLLFASDYDLKDEGRIWVMPIQQFIVETRKFAQHPFEYQMPPRRPR